MQTQAAAGAHQQGAGAQSPDPADAPSRFAVQAARPSTPADDGCKQCTQAPAATAAAPLDADAAAIAAEAADDLSALPDVGGRGCSGTDAASKAKGGSAAPAAAGAADRAPSRLPSSSRHKHKRKLIPLKRVMRDTYEYHGLNDLFFFCITALSVTLVLYWHWGETTATFKATVQSSFQQYGNPDWQSQSFANVDTMYDAVEYTVGWLEFWLQRADSTGWPNQTVRVGEFADVRYVRMLVNLERNCELSQSTSHMLCVDQDPLTQELRSGLYGNRSSSSSSSSAGARRYPGYDNLLEWSGWENVGKLRGRDAQDAGRPSINKWWAYSIIAPTYQGRQATYDDFIGRMYNITRSTNLNYNDCDWAAYNCSAVGPYTPLASGPKCAQTGPQVPFQSWWAKPDMCASRSTPDRLPPGTRALQRGQRFFVRDPRVTDPAKSVEGGNVINLKPFLTKYAYSIAVDVLATNAASQPAGKGSNSDPDMALFTMIVQRSAQAKDKPDRLMWQITTTLPVRTSFYSQTSDMARIAFEALMHVCIFVVLSLQVWQVTVCYKQHCTFKPWVKHMWNCFELLSNITLLAWVVFYWVLFTTLKRQRWNMNSWGLENQAKPAQELDNITQWSGYYSTWLYMGIVVDFLICLRLTRYMRIHVGLKAFYQVFIIAAREFLDFAVFLFYILVLLGSAVFAFFQLTGGNFQFLRFPDGLSLMSRLTFGFLSYEDFQSQALGVGAAVSAVTGLFWVAVLLLVVYTQNIILAIVAEAYEEAKAKLGTAPTSFLMLVLMRILFTTLFVIYRIRMLCRDILYACTGWRRFKHDRPPSFKRAGSLGDSATFLAGGDPPDGPAGSAHIRASASGNQGGSNTSSNGQAGQPGDDLDAFGDDQGLALTTSASRYLLPFDVEEGLAGSYTSSQAGPGSQSSRFSSRLRLLSLNRRTASQSSDATSPAPAAAGPGSGTGTGGGVFNAGSGAADPGSKGLGAGASRSLKGEEPQGLAKRLSSIWHDVILGERHMLRMYNDVYLAPGESANSWVAKWKATYWRPWCVARTAPLHCLMNLYQDFASYKLKEDCTWMANNAAKEVIGRTWHGETDSLTPQHSGGSSGAAKDATVAISADDSAEPMPLLADEAWVTEAELARLFLVTSNMSTVLRIWYSPFKRLSRKEVSYLVKGIADVYGRDEDEVLCERQQLLLAHGGDDGGFGSMKDARLGLGAPRRTGGFFSGLNQKRRDGGQEHGRQVTLLLHTNKRLEEATHKTAAQLSSTTASLKLQMNAQQAFQRRQQETNAQLLRGLQDLHHLLHAQQPFSSQAPGGAAPAQAGMAGGADRAGSSSGVCSPRMAGHASSAKRFNSKIFGGKSKVQSSGDQAQLALLGGEGGSHTHHPMRSASNLSTRSGGGQDDPDALEPLAEAGGGVQQHAAADGSAQLVQSLQQQLEQQQKAFQAQQELLQQVLARLPAAAPQP